LEEVSGLQHHQKHEERSEEVIENKGSGPEAALLLATGNRVVAW
jgi:hypothetical protein